MSRTVVMVVCPCTTNSRYADKQAKSKKKVQLQKNIFNRFIWFESLLIETRCDTLHDNMLTIVIIRTVFLQNKLKVYLAPFIHGMRYTSFGRHFTKVDKLKEVRAK